MGEQTVVVNRAPVLTLWAAVVAERQGFEPDAALTFGKAVAGLNAQSKGRALGIYQAPESSSGQAEPRHAERAEQFWIPVCGRPVPAKNTPAGVRAVVEDRPIDPAGVTSYLERSFGDSLGEVRAAMVELAASFPREELESVAYELYEKFRPTIESGTRGWGQKAKLDIGLIRSLSNRSGKH